METRRALVTGVSGQDGAWLSKFLLAKGYEVHGIVRRHAQPVYPNLETLDLVDRLVLHEGDLLDQDSLDSIVQATKPHEIYNLGALSHVGLSFTQADVTYQVTGQGPIRMLAAMRRHAPAARFYQAGSSEQWGNALEIHPELKILDEDSPRHPVSPYAVAKEMACKAVEYHRRAYGLHASTGLLYNHESELRGERFVTRKVTRALARIKLGLQPSLQLGNCDAQRDWGYAPEYVEAMWQMLQRDEPGDLLIATGEAHSVAEWVASAWHAVGLPSEPDDRVRVVSSELRPADIMKLKGNPARAKRELGWEAATTFSRGPKGSLVEVMARHDLKIAKEEAARAENGAVAPRVVV